jgi:hypothetical protein
MNEKIYICVRLSQKRRASQIVKNIAPRGMGVNIPRSQKRRKKIPQDILSKKGSRSNLFQIGERFA